jgi:outer membrane protein assembly factor BamB
VFNWAEGRLAVLFEEGWETTEAATHHYKTHVFDTGDDVYFYCHPKLYRMDAANRIHACEVPLELPGERPSVHAAKWGTGRALLLCYDERGVQGFELATGKPVDVTRVNEMLDNRSVYDLFSAPDGSVWVLGHEPRLRSYVFYRVTPEGGVEPIEALAGFGWDNNQFRGQPRMVLGASDGSFWFGLFRDGLLHYDRGRTHLFDGREGLNLGAGLTLLEDARGRIYAASPRAVYAFTPHGQPSLRPAQPGLPPRRPTFPGRPTWTYLPPFPDISAVCRAKDAICLAESSTGVLTVLDPADGRSHAQIPLPGGRFYDASLTPGLRPGETVLAYNGAILRFDTSRGETLERINCPLNSRIGAVPLDDGGYLVVRSGRTLARIDREGKEVWECEELSGYIDVRPTVYGAFGVVQTRQGSYGGQAVAGVDLNTGERLWSKRTDAYGCGAAFGDDATYVVETSQWLSPQLTKGQVVCRNPRTGEELWSHQLPGTISYRPLIDRRRNRVVVVSDRGEVACLNGADGRLVWRTLLPENPYPTREVFYDPYRRVVAFHEDRLLTLDRNRVLHSLQAENGRIEASIAVSVGFSPKRRNLPEAELVAMPWIEGEHLIVAARQGVVAYRLDELPERP